MKKSAALFLATLALMCLSATAFAAGKFPNGGCPPVGVDSVSIFAIENPAAGACHPATLDTVLGVRGIITGFDAKASAYGFWIQNRGSGGWNGVQVFTGATNYAGSVPGTPTGGNLVLGDSVVVYGTTQEFPAINGGTELEGPDAVQGTNDIIIRKIASAVPLPAFHVGTTAELNWIPGATQEQWEGTLVKLKGPLHVARIAQGFGVSFGTFLIVANATPSDTVMIDGITLTTYTAPAVNTVLDSIQGILQQNTSSGATGAINSYRIQIRDANDVFSATPPNVLNAFFTEDNKIRVVFDRNVTAASAGNTANYSLVSFGSVNSATVLTPTTVELNITSGFTECTLGEGVTVNGVVASGSGLPMTTAQTRNFVAGVVPLSCVQSPDAAFLAGSPCDDRSRYAGAGALAGDNQVTTRGVCIAQLGSVFYIADGSTRGGVGVFGPPSTLIVGHRYLIAGEIQEFGGETELVFAQYVADEGVQTPPAPVVKTLPVLRDTTCDAGQSIQTGEDYEATLAKISYVKVVENRNPGQGFFVVSLAPASTDTFLVSSSNTTYSYQPDSLDVVDVTGIIRFSSGTFRITPRGDADIVSHGHVTGVPTNLPKALAFSVHPNPSRVATVSFALPTRGLVDVGVYDLAGRKVASLINGVLEAGSYTRSWGGMSDNGNKVGAGVYFYRLRTAGETRTIRSVHIQ